MALNNLRTGLLLFNVLRLLLKSMCFAMTGRWPARSCSYKHQLINYYYLPVTTSSSTLFSNSDLGTCEFRTSIERLTDWSVAWSSTDDRVPVVVDVALSSADTGLPDYFFLLPAGRQSGTVRPLPLHDHTPIDPTMKLCSGQSITK